MEGEGERKAQTEEMKRLQKHLPFETCFMVCDFGAEAPLVMLTG